MNAKTFDEWKAIGRVVRFGERSKQRNEHGKAVFDKSQTTDVLQRGHLPQVRRGHLPWQCADVDYDDPMQFDDWMGKHG